MGGAIKTCWGSEDGAVGRFSGSTWIQWEDCVGGRMGGQARRSCVRSRAVGSVAHASP